MEGAVLYNAGHYSALMHNVALRLTFHADKKAVLLILSTSGNEVVKKLEQNGIFDKVIIYRDDTSIEKECEILDINSDYFDNLLEKNSLDCASFDEIYVECDQVNAFGLYLVNRNIRHNMIEMNPDQFNDVWRSQSLMERGIISVNYHEIQMRAGVITGKNPLITVIKNNYNGKIEKNNIDFTALLKKIDPKYKELLLTTFNVPKISNSSQLLVMNSFNNCSGNSVFSYDQSPYIYQMILDYLIETEEDVVIKQHPHDAIQLDDFPYKSLSKDIPLELLCIHDGVRIKRAFSIQSTATDKIKETIVDDVRIGWAFFKLCHLMHHIRIISSIIVEKKLTSMPIFTKLTSYPSHEAHSMSVILSILFKHKVRVRYLADSQAIEKSIIISSDPSDCIGDSNICFYINYEKSVRCADAWPTGKELAAVDIAVVPYDSFRGNTLIQRLFVTGLKCESVCIEKRLKNCHASLSYNISPSLVMHEASRCNAMIEPNILCFNADTLGRLGRAYRDGKGIGRSLNDAAEWMRISADRGIGWAKNELFDILWMIDTPESHAEMVRVAADYADAGDGGAMGRLGHAYRDGKGVGRDHNLAAQWYRKAADLGIRWAERELARLVTTAKK